MKIAIIGSRKWADEQAVIAYVDSLPADSLVISGGAKGVDTIAIVAAQLRGLETLVFPANWRLWGNGAGGIRNGEMIKAGLGLVAAFWDMSSTGTADMIARAKRAGVPYVINPVVFVMPVKQQRMF